MSTEVITFGCRLNSYESEAIRNQLSEANANNTLVFNSCAVTKEAERQLRQALRRARKTHPEHKIIVTGCAAQIAPERYAAMEEVDLVLGNEEKFHAKYYNPTLTESNEARIKVNDIMSIKETASHLISNMEGKARAFVQIQNGCNHRCTFCIIPYGRGNSRSVPIGEIVSQVNLLVAHGYHEVVLTGVDISDYGKDLPGKPSLAEMLQRLLRLVPQLSRLRLSSIDVAEIDDALIELIIHEPRIMPHIHISLQAGDDMILKRMKRRHNRKQVIDFCNHVRSMRPEIVFGADIIAGFPTETEEMFTNTLNLIEEAAITYIHAFPYSEREGTPAARMPQIDKAIRKKRAAKLRERGEAMVATLYQQLIGSTQQVIIEQDNVARAANFAHIMLQDNLAVGSLHEVTITAMHNHYLTAEVN